MAGEFDDEFADDGYDDDAYPDDDEGEEDYEVEEVPQRPPMARPVRSALPAQRALPIQGEERMTRQALDWGISGSIIAILILTALYAFSPVDFVPDVIPVAGQADDVAAILAGGGSVAFLTALRFILRTRVGRLGCLIGIVLAAIGAFVVFWTLMRVFESVV